MAKNIVICCDGTGNEIEANLSNVLKLYRIVRKNEEQVVFYDPGIGTIGTSDPWSRLKSNALGILGLSTGYGLDENILDAYRFLVNTYDEGDKVYLFGFSRGAYTIRVLAGLLRLVGLLHPAQLNLSEYALIAYKKVSEDGDFEIPRRFEQVTSTRRVPIRFAGVWDTVSSVIVPRPDRCYLPRLQLLPYTRTNSYVDVFRQAIAIDERRRMFQLNRWKEPQTFQPNPFDDANAKAQDIKQVWFSGVHSDIGGGYPEDESGPAKYPLGWLIDEAVVHGLQISRTMYDHLVLGHARNGGRRSYTPPSVSAEIHNSMTWGWLPLEVIPKRVKWRDWSQRRSFLGWYLPLREPRRIDDGSLVHYSVFERMAADPAYRPVNLPPKKNLRSRDRLNRPSLP